MPKKKNVEDKFAYAGGNRRHYIIKQRIGAPDRYDIVATANSENAAATIITNLNSAAVIDAVGLAEENKALHQRLDNQSSSIRANQKIIDRQRELLREKEVVVSELKIKLAQASKALTKEKI